MTQYHFAYRFVAVSALLACGLGMPACQFLSTRASAQPAQAQTETAPQDEDPLTIKNDSDLPDTFPQADYQVHLLARGGAAPLHWQLKQGTLPPGIKLQDDGLLYGAAERAGEFQFTVSVIDSGRPPRQADQKQFVIRVRSALNLIWKTPAHVNGALIEGSVEVSNTSPDDVDLTFDVKSVAEDGRATEIGYQHFVLRRTVTKELPFGESLPHGGYMVYVNAVAEVAPKKLIYRERMQTQGPLQVMVGP